MVDADVSLHQKHRNFCSDLRANLCYLDVDILLNFLLQIISKLYQYISKLYQQVLVVNLKFAMMSVQFP